MRLIFLVILSAIVLHGCTTINGYEDPEGNKATLATLKGTMKSEGLAHFTAVSVQAIDEKNIPFMRRGTAFSFKLSPGTHKILVDGSFNNGWGPDCPCEARLVVNANFQAGRSYRLRGRVKDNRMLAWVEDEATGKRVSGVAEEPYVRSPRDTYYPVFVPTG